MPEDPNILDPVKDAKRIQELDEYQFTFPERTTTEEALSESFQESMRRDAVAATDVGDLVSNAVAETWAFAPWFSEAHEANFAFDHGWEGPSPEWEEQVKRELPYGQWDDVLYARSEEHSRAVFQDIKSRQQMQGVIAERYGPVTMMASYLGAAIFDPVNIVMMAGTGPVYSSIAQSGKFAMGARFLRTGALAGTEAVAWGTLRAAAGDPLLDESDILTIGGFGAVLGGGFGAVFGKYAPDIADKANALKLASEGATLSEKGFLATRRGQGRWRKSPHIDDQPHIKYRPPALHDDNQRAYGYVSVIGTPERGPVGINIAKSPFEEMSFLQGGVVQYKNKNITMSGFIQMDEGQLVVRFNADSIRTKGMVDVGELRAIEDMVNKTMRDFLDDMDAHGLGDFLRRTGADDPTPGRPAPRLLTGHSRQRAEQRAKEARRRAHDYLQEDLGRPMTPGEEKEAWRLEVLSLLAQRDVRAAYGAVKSAAEFEKRARRLAKRNGIDFDEALAEAADSSISTLRPEVHPDEPLSMLPRSGQVLDGEGNARIPGDSAITIEARVDKMVQDHGIESLDRWIQSFKGYNEYFQMVSAASKPGRSAKEIEDIVRPQVVRRAKEMFTAYIRDISENRRLGKEFIGSLEDFRPLAKLSEGDLERSDVFSLLNWTKHTLRDSVHEAAAEREAARVIADVPAGQHFKGGVLEEAYRLSRDPKSDVHLVWMTPDEFSRFTIPLKPGVPGDKGQSVESLVELLKGGTKLNDIPTLTIVPAPKRDHGVYEVTQHNGRHRAEAFRELGITEIPVLIKGGEGSNIKGSSLSSLSVSPPTILRNERGYGKTAYKNIVQEDKPFPIRQSPSVTFASIDEATAALRREAILAKGPELTISARKAAPKAPAPKAPVPKTPTERIASGEFPELTAVMRKTQEHANRLDADAAGLGSSGGGPTWAIAERLTLIHKSKEFGTLVDSGAVSKKELVTATRQLHELLGTTAPKGLQAMKKEDLATFHIDFWRKNILWEDLYPKAPAPKAPAAKEALDVSVNLGPGRHGIIKKGHAYVIEKDPAAVIEEGMARGWYIQEYDLSTGKLKGDEYGHFFASDFAYGTLKQAKGVVDKWIAREGPKKVATHTAQEMDEIKARDYTAQGAWEQVDKRKEFWSFFDHEAPAPKAPRRIATEYTATISDDAHKLFNKENADFNFPIPKEVRIKVRTKEEGLNELGGKYDMHMWGEEVPLFAKTKANLAKEVQGAMENPILVPQLQKHFREDKLIDPEITEVPALPALSRASQPDELSGFTAMRGNKELTNTEIQRLIHESDPVLRPYGEVMTWYHGTSKEGFDLPTGQPGHSGDVFASPNRDWSVKWVKDIDSDDVRVIEMVITPKNVFDGGNPDHIRKFVEARLPRARADVKHAESELAKAVKSSDPMATTRADAVRASQRTLNKLLRAMESDEALRKYGSENLAGWSAIQDNRGKIHALGFDAAFENEAVRGLTAQNIRLFDPENQIHVAKKAKESLMPTELVAVKQGHLLKLDELETIISVVETKHPEYALTPAWQGFLDSVAGHRQSARRPQWQRSVDPDDIIIDVPPTKKQTKKKPFEGVSEEDAAKYRAQAERFDELAEDLQPGDRILQLGDTIFIHNTRTGRNVRLQDIVDEINKSADDVVAETARHENKVFNKRNLDAFKGTVAKGGDDAAKLDLDEGFKEAGVHGPTLGGPGDKLWNSRKTQLQNTVSDAFNWVSLHVFGNQAGAETRAGRIVTVIEDADSWLRLGAAVDRDNLGVSLASDARKAVKQNLKEWKRETRQNFGDIFTRRSRATFRRDVARVLRDNDLLSADPNTLSKADQIVQRTAKVYSETFKKTLAWLRKNDPDGPWKDIPDNANYFPRMWSENGHARLVKEFSEEQVQELIAKALRQGTRDGAEPMSQAQAMRFAELYLKRVGSNKFQMSWINHPSMAASNPKQFMQKLMDDLGISEEEAMRFTSLFAKKVDDGTHGKFRVSLDETTTMTMRGADGQTRTVTFDELLNNDVVGVTDRYLHSVLSTAAEREVVRIFSQKMGLEGVFKSMDDLRPHLLNDLVSKGAKMRDAEEMFENMLRELRGTPHSDSAVFAQNARMIRDANYTLGAGSGFGLSALGDAANALFSQGGRNALEAIGILRKMTKSGQRLDIDDDIKFLLESCALSDRKLDAMKLNPIIDELGDLPGAGGRTAETLRQAATTMSDVSGINAVTTNAEKLALKVHALKYIRQMLDGETPNDVRLAQMGYTPESWARDAAYMRRHAKRYIGGDGVETIKPNFGDWADNQTGVRRFQAAMESEVTSHVVRADMNDLPAFFHKNGFSLALGQLLLQFRNFGITATRSTLVRNVKANDARSYITFLSAVAGGGLVYTLKMRLRYGDDDEAFQESMQWDRWVQGAMSNSAIGATMEIGDATKALMTGEGMTGHRWAPSDRFLGDVPTARTADAIFRTAGIPFKALQGKELTPGDYRALQDISLIGNHPLVRMGKNALQTQEN